MMGSQPPFALLDPALEHRSRQRIPSSPSDENNSPRLSPVRQIAPLDDEVFVVRVEESDWKRFFLHQSGLRRHSRSECTTLVFRSRDDRVTGHHAATIDEVRPVPTNFLLVAINLDAEECGSNHRGDGWWSGNCGETFQGFVRWVGHTFVAGPGTRGASAPLYLFSTSSKFISSLASIVQAASVLTSSAASGLDSPTVMSCLASASLAA